MTDQTMMQMLRCMNALGKLGYENESIYSWKDLSKDFTIQFTVWKWQPTKMVVLSGVIQRKKETLHEYIDHFT